MQLTITIPDSTIQSLADAISASLAERLAEKMAESRDRALGGKLFFSEPEAADMLGISSWTLKRAMLNGEIEATACGKRLIRYSREQIEAAQAWLAKR